MANISEVLIKPRHRQQAKGAETSPALKPPGQRLAQKGRGPLQTRCLSAGHTDTAAGGKGLPKSLIIDKSVEQDNPVAPHTDVETKPQGQAMTRRAQEVERSERRLVMSRIRVDALTVKGGHYPQRKLADVPLVLIGEKSARPFSVEEC
jgi:hypothetical protein